MDCAYSLRGNLEDRDTVVGLERSLFKALQYVTFGFLYRVGVAMGIDGFVAKFITFENSAKFEQGQAAALTLSDQIAILSSNLDDIIDPVGWSSWDVRASGQFDIPQVQQQWTGANKIGKRFNISVWNSYWTTINEPNITVELGYLRGIYPPAHCSAPFGNSSVGNSEREPLLVVHNMLISHAKAAHLYREHYQPKQGGFIGVVVHRYMFEPISDQEVDREAARRALAFNSGWVLDPLLNGDCPPEMHGFLGQKMPKFSPDELEKLKDTVDFIGLNHYSSSYAKDCIYSPCESGGCVIKGFVYITGERDGIPIGEETALPYFYVVPRGLEKLID
ncbi:hypothetical protein L1049_000533 [Liquidambar formosana]|uniref:Beta-glucosidase n=1 Tax=Liquidambar formosana TaxID=63359 RepID=A0AAP0R7S7_LIQFO